MKHSAYSGSCHGLGGAVGLVMMFVGDGFPVLGERGCMGRLEGKLERGVHMSKSKDTEFDFKKNAVN